VRNNSILRLWDFAKSLNKPSNSLAKFLLRPNARPNPLGKLDKPASTTTPLANLAKPASTTNPLAKLLAKISLAKPASPINAVFPKFFFQATT
jgi:hypothetical protein